jgi:hypothetical protein
MPAIEPARLSREIQSLLADFDRPGTFVERALSLLEFYADRLSRPGAHAAMRAPFRTLSVPSPVMNSLRQALHRTAAAQPLDAWDVADGLWAVGYHETHVLAAAVMEAQTDARAAAWVEARLAGQLDDRLRLLLAKTAWGGWRAADPNSFIALTEDWIRGKDPMRQAFALLALQSAAENRDPPFLARLFDLLYRLPPLRQPKAQRARLDLLGALAGGSPAETAAYLLHEHQRGASGSDRTLRDLLPRFPPDWQARLRASLRG